jgi:hypothetical protein
VKVIEHSGDTSAVVENEVKLMMQVCNTRHAALLFMVFSF